MCRQTGRVWVLELPAVSVSKQGTITSTAEELHTPFLVFKQPENSFDIRCFTCSQPPQFCLPVWAAGSEEDAPMMSRRCVCFCVNTGGQCMLPPMHARASWLLRRRFVFVQNL